MLERIEEPLHVFRRDAVATLFVGSDDEDGGAVGEVTIAQLLSDSYAEKQRLDKFHSKIFNGDDARERLPNDTPGRGEALFSKKSLPQLYAAAGRVPQSGKEGTMLVQEIREMFSYIVKIASDHEQFLQGLFADVDFDDFDARTDRRPPRPIRGRLGANMHLMLSIRLQRTLEALVDLEDGQPRGPIIDEQTRATIQHTADFLAGSFHFALADQPYTIPVLPHGDFPSAGLRQTCRGTILSRLRELKAIKRPGSLVGAVKSEPKILVVDELSSRVLSSCCSCCDIFDAGFCMIDEGWASAPEHDECHSADGRTWSELEVVYFVAPTATNVMRICNDSRRGVLGTRTGVSPPLDVLFTSKPPGALLTKLVHSVGEVIGVVEVLDLDFITVDDRVFDLDMKSTGKNIMELAGTIHQHHLIAEKISQVCLQLDMLAPTVRWYDARAVREQTNDPVAAACRVAASHACCRVAELVGHKLRDFYHDTKINEDKRVAVESDVAGAEKTLRRGRSELEKTKVRAKTSLSQATKPEQSTATLNSLRKMNSSITASANKLKHASRLAEQHSDSTPRSVVYGVAERQPHSSLHRYHHKAITEGIAKKSESTRHRVLADSSCGFLVFHRFADPITCLLHGESAAAELSSDDPMAGPGETARMTSSSLHRRFELEMLNNRTCHGTSKFERRLAEMEVNLFKDVMSADDKARLLLVFLFSCPEARVDQRVVQHLDSVGIGADAVPAVFAALDTGLSEQSNGIKIASAGFHQGTKSSGQRKSDTATLRAKLGTSSQLLNSRTGQAKLDLAKTSPTKSISSPPKSGIENTSTSNASIIDLKPAAAANLSFLPILCTVIRNLCADTLDAKLFPKGGAAGPGVSRDSSGRPVLKKLVVFVVGGVTQSVRPGPRVVYLPP